MADCWSFGPFNLDLAERRLRREGADVDIGPRALDVLAVLVAHAGQLVTKQDLLDRAWPGRIVEENNLQVQVSTLRQRLGADAITTIAGRGYRFERPVVAIERDAPHGRGPTSIPAPLAPIVGRVRELAELSRELAANRLVTIVGAGGIGKTRLAVEIAARAATGADSTPGRIVFCDLSTVSDTALVATALAASAGIALSETDAVDALRAAWSRGATLLLIDNAEQVRAGVAELLAELLPAVASCRALVTSQISLGVPGEVLYRLEPLPLPSSDAVDETIAGSDAVAFFVAAVRALDRRFALHAENAQTIAEICRALDGIPLALQLAAARVPQLGAGGLQARLDQRLRLLARPDSPAPRRQQALAAALDWSYSLLGPAEKALLSRIGVLAGEFDLADVARLLDRDPLEVIEELSALVDHSLVVADAHDPPRYRLLETVRLYALEQLVENRDHPFITRAIAFLRQRADVLAESSGVAGAAIDYAAALDLCTRLEPDGARDALELDLLLRLGPAVQASSSPGSPRCESVYGRALELARRGDPGVAQFKALWGYWQFLAMAGRDREAATLTAELGALADTIGEEGLQLEAAHARFSTSQLLGDALATRAQAEAVITRYDRTRHHALTHEFGGHDPGVCALGQGAVATWLTGDVGRALERAMEAERLGSTFDHAYTRAVGYYYAAMTYAACGAWTQLDAASQALVAVSSEYSMAVLLTEGRLFQGYARFALGEQAIGVQAMSAAYEEIYAARDFGFVPYYATLLAQARLSLGDVLGAASVLAQAREIAAAGQGFFLPEVERLAGQVAAARGNTNDARAAYRRARTVARHQGALALELRAVVDILRAESDPEERIAARSQLSALLDTAPMTPQLGEWADARQLLASFGTPSAPDP